MVKAFIVVKEAEREGGIKLARKRSETLSIRELGVSYSVVILQKPEYINHPKIRTQLTGVPIIISNALKAVCKWDYREVSLLQYETELFLNGMRVVLSGLPAEYKRKQVVLIDIKGRYQKLADCLIEKFASVRIITSCPELYRYYVDEKLYECGAALTVSDKVTVSSDTVCCVSPDGVVFQEMLKGNIRVFTPFAPSSSSAYYSVNSFRAMLSKCYTRRLSNGIDEFHFAAALYKYCGLRIPELLIPVSVLINNEEFSIEKAKKILFSLDTY